MQETHLLPGSLQEDTSSKIRLPPISFLSQVPIDFSPMKAKDSPVGRPAAQLSEAASASKVKLQQKQSYNHSEFKSGARVPNVGQSNSDQVPQLANTQLSASQPFQNQLKPDEFRQNQNLPQNYHTHPSPQQYQAPPQYGFQSRQQAPQQTAQRPEAINREPSEVSQVPPQRSTSSLHHHHHHHHHSHEQEHRHHHHHHHHSQHNHSQHNHSQHNHQKHHQHRHSSQSAATSSLNTDVKVEHVSAGPKAEGGSKRPKVQISGTSVSKRLKKLVSTLNLKRKHLGTLVYNPTTTWDNLQVAQLRGLDTEERLRLLQLQESSRIRAKECGMKQNYLPILPPLSETQVNNLVEVKIPYKFVKEFQLQFQKSAYSDAMKVWGGHGGVFSDDSDILGALQLSGIFTGTLNLEEWNSSWNSSQIVKPALVHKDKDGFELLDLCVTLLLLPGLENYHGMYQNGVYSRSWVGQSPHDGLSYAIYNVKWETFGQFGKEFSKTLKKLHQEEEEMSLQLQSRRNGWVFKNTGNGQNNAPTST